MKRPSFLDPPDLWLRDGSFRDVYVLCTSHADWRTFLDLATELGAIYRYEGTQQSVPEPAAIFENREGTHLLQVDIRGVQINCHFFVPEEIELDIDPRQVADALCHEAVLKFIEDLGRRVRKPVVLTPENMPESPLLSYDPVAIQWTVHSDTEWCR